MAERAKGVAAGLTRVCSLDQAHHSFPFQASPGTSAKPRRLPEGLVAELPDPKESAAPVTPDFAIA